MPTKLDLTVDIIDNLRRLADKFYHAKKELLHKNSLREVELEALHLISGPGCTFKNLQEQMKIPKHQAKRIADSLKKKGFVEIAVNTKDRRSRKIRTTTKGLELLYYFRISVANEFTTLYPALKLKPKIEIVAYHLSYIMAVFAGFK